MENLNKMNEYIHGVCPGCGRDEFHKFCPAWGTKYYMSGTYFTKEMEEETKEEREEAIRLSIERGNSCLD